MAANTRDIRRRIKSVKNTAQITKAMQMVAASKMRKAQQRALDGRPYAELLNKISSALDDVILDDKHPLLQRREVKKEMVIVISTDKGLCGALNTNLLREAAKFDAGKTVFITAGRKGAQWAVRSKRDLLADFTLSDTASFLETKPISKMAVEKFLDGSVDKVTLLVTRFINTLTQEPIAIPLLPVSPPPASHSAAAKSILRRPVTRKRDRRCLRAISAGRSGCVASLLRPFWRVSRNDRSSRRGAQRPHGGDEERDR